MYYTRYWSFSFFSSNYSLTKKDVYMDGSNIISTVSSCSLSPQDANFVERIPLRTDANPDDSTANALLLFVCNCAFSDTNALCKPLHSASRMACVDSVSFPSSKVICVNLRKRMCIPFTSNEDLNLTAFPPVAC
mmetsp:Transcript_22972/g.32084  ORF Transcript_22972/g.32084 Transcript_22972/m.32084 type:complete len:134 (-) Transcript_22972:1006-1407(-)